MLQHETLSPNKKLCRLRSPLVMKRKVSTILPVALGHFFISIILVFIFFKSVSAKEMLGIELSDIFTGWLLMVFLFPVRNALNRLVRYPDRWLFRYDGFLVIAGSSLVWALAIFLSSGGP